MQIILDFWSCSWNFCFFHLIRDRGMKWIFHPEVLKDSSKRPSWAFWRTDDRHNRDWVWGWNRGRGCKSFSLRYVRWCHKFVFSASTLRGIKSRFSNSKWCVEIFKRDVKGSIVKARIASDDRKLRYKNWKRDKEILYIHSLTVSKRVS